jgi:hypothetical protein
MATAAEIQTAAQGVLDAQNDLATASAAFNALENAAQAACAAESAAVASAMAAQTAALATARNADPAWAAAYQVVNDAQLALGAAVVALSTAASQYDGQ